MIISEKEHKHKISILQNSLFCTNNSINNLIREVSKIDKCIIRQLHIINFIYKYPKLNYKTLK